MAFCMECRTSLPGGGRYCPGCGTRWPHHGDGSETGDLNAAPFLVMEPEMMIAQVRLTSAPVQNIESFHHHKSRAVSALVAGIVTVLLGLLGSIAIVITVGRIIIGAAASG